MSAQRNQVSTVFLTPMIRTQRRPNENEFSLSFLILIAALVVSGMSPARAAAPIPTGAQTAAQIPPDATPQIQEVKPNQVAAGSEVQVVVNGQNFSAGAYVSFSDPQVHVVSSRCVSPTQLEADLAISKKARPGAVTLYVSNPASTVAETVFTILEAAPAQPPAPATPPPPSKPSPAPPAPAPAPEVHPAAPGAPEVVKVEPASAQRGDQAKLKITGKNFAPGAKVAFSNSGVRLVDVNASTTTEMTATIQVAPDAKTGPTSLFVVNPDESEVEAAFEIIPPGGSGEKPAATETAGATATSPAANQTFSVYNLGNAASILQSAGKTNATLAISGGKLKCDEGGKEVFSAALTDIQEVEENSIFGVKSGTFHIILRTGKTYNFIASSLKPADTEAIIAALHAVIKQQ